MLPWLLPRDFKERTPERTPLAIFSPAPAASLSDQWLARRFYDDGVPLQVVETALLLGSLRRLIRPADAPRLSPIRSLAYCRPVIEELRAHPAPESYLNYLRLKLRQVAADVNVFR